MASFEEIKRDQASATETVPAGVIQAFAGAAAPSGWALCDGAVLDQATYPKLYAALGATWDTFAHPVDGTPGVAGGQFALPNLKGLYLAGEGNAGGDVRTLGSFQADKTAKNGLSNASSSTSGTAAGQGGGASNTGYTEPNVINYDNSSGWHISNSTGTSGKKALRWQTTGANTSGQLRAQNHRHSQVAHTHSASSVSGTASAQTISGDTETRPKTAPVNYIIKL